MKFKNIKKKTYKKKSPSNSRSITEGFKFSLPKFNSVKLLKLYGKILILFVISVFIVAVVIVGLDLYKNLKVKEAIDSQRDSFTYELNFWEEFISKHQDYKDAYFQASILEYKLGNTSKAKMYAEKGLSLDPNSEEGRKIKKFFNR